MPRRRMMRTADEDIEFQRLRRERNAEFQRQRRSASTSASVATNHSVAHGYTGQIVLTQHVRPMDAIERQRCCRARRRQYPDIDPCVLNHVVEVEENYIGPMSDTCTHCHAKHFAAEKINNRGNSFNDCCSHGAVCLESMPIPSNELISLFNGTHAKSANFFKNIRSYNSSFAFASFNTNLVNFNQRRPGPYCFKIQGQIYYQVNTTLCPVPGESPSYGQLFIIDSNEAVDCRLNQNSNLDREIILIIDRFMRENNLFAKSYRMMGEELRLQQEQAFESGESLPNLQLLFTLKPGMDRRRFNFQRVNEVAAVFSTTADSEIPESYVTVRNKITKELQTVSSMDPNVEPWIYPLFHPFGTRGWHRNLTMLNKEKRISRAAYVKYRIAIRDDGFNSILLGRRLFQQWIVDSYVKIEKDRIEFLKANQKQLRTETYHGLIDHLQNAANQGNARIGKMVILPSTFVGSPRNMMQHYQDAMGIVRRFGKPDLFLTMTCNPNWREIKENLLPHQTPADRPDICARVFNIKKDCLLDLIVRQKYFGEAAAYVYVIEFQKRGLPHMHLLVTLNGNYKITTPEVVDRYISAEIPNPIDQPTLHQIVLQNMIHGPCGSWCEVDGRCSKNYPKSFRNDTVMDEDGYPFYRRRDTGVTFERPGGYIVDNRHVVPYCPKLSLLFNSHINVEIVSSIRSVKYLYKYVYKGYDAAAVVVNESASDSVIVHDEIQDYVEARYVGPVEACWRILSKPLQQKSHTIIRLPVHLPQEQSITICSDFDDDAMISALSQITMLMDYFELNQRDIDAKKYIYTDIPEHYVYKTIQLNGQNTHRWERRQRKFNIIGRMYSVSPSQIELFHLRLLLLTVKGATSYESLRTVNGVIHPTFNATCLALGLIEDDEEWRRAMSEAAIWMMPRCLRRLFVRILIHCQPVHPEEIWEEFKFQMSEDFSRRLGGILEGQKTAYARIAAMLSTEGQDLSNFPSMQQVTELLETDDRLLPEQSNAVGMAMYAQMNEHQKAIVDVILQAVDSEDETNRTNCFYIDGQGGTGKTFIYTTLSHLLKSRKKHVTTMAFTGIAATLLPQGRTVHKTLGLPVPLFADSTSNIKIQSKEGKYLQKIDVIIWDEAPMAPRYALEVMNRTLCDLMNSESIFGGKIVILGGDFRQLLPIKIRGTRSEIINLSIKNSFLWTHFEKHSLTRNMRVLPEEIEFAEFVLNVGDGTLNTSNDAMELPERCVAAHDADIVEDIYGKLIREDKFAEMAKCAILSARNVDVDEINRRVVELLDDKEERIYTSVDNAENCYDNGEINEALLPEYLNTLAPPSLPPHQLRLRKNSIIMLIRNLSINEGLCNGTRLMILNLTNNVLRCEIITGDNAGDIVYLNRITLYCENVYPFTFKRRQFPIKLAFAMTINKSQGQTFDRIGLDLRRDIFNHGQLYVALSRVRSWDALKVYLGTQREGRFVKNVVYKELYN